MSMARRVVRLHMRISFHNATWDQQHHYRSWPVSVSQWVVLRQGSRSPCSGVVSVSHRITNATSRLRTPKSRFRQDETEIARSAACYFFRTIFNTWPCSNSRISEFAVSSRMMLLRFSSCRVCRLSVVIRRVLSSTAMRALTVYAVPRLSAWISSVPLREKAKVPPCIGPSFTSHVPRSSGGTEFKKNLSTTTHVPLPTRSKQRAPRAQCRSVSFRPFSGPGLVFDGFVFFCFFNSASLEDSFMIVPDVGP